MATTRAWTTPKSTGERVTAAEFNNLNDLPMARGDANDLLDDMSIDLGNFDLFITNTGGGTGRFDVDLDYTELSGAAWPTFASARTIPNWAPPFETFYNASSFSFSASAPLGAIQVASPAILYFMITLPVDAVVTAFRVPVQKPAAGVGLPSTMPAISLDYISSAGALTAVGSQTDTTASEAAYETYHLIAKTSLSHTVAAGRRYIISVSGDNTSSGTSDGLVIYPPFVDLSITKVRF